MVEYPKSQPWLDSVASPWYHQHPLSSTQYSGHDHREAEAGSNFGSISGPSYLFWQGYLQLSAQVIFMLLSSSRVRTKCQSTMSPYISPNTFTSRHLTKNAKPIFSKSCFKTNYLHSWETKPLTTQSSPFPQK